MEIKKKIIHNRINIRTNLKVVAVEAYLVGKLYLIYLLPADQAKEKDMKELL